MRMKFQTGKISHPCLSVGVAKDQSNDAALKAVKKVVHVVVGCDPPARQVTARWTVQGDHEVHAEERDEHECRPYSFPVFKKSDQKFPNFGLFFLVILVLVFVPQLSSHLR